jgi:hypothetical protein
MGRALVAMFLVAAWSLAAAPASAVTFGFGCITNNLAGDCAIAEAQMSVDVTDAAGQALFTFSNTGADDSSITDVYFDDGALLSIVLIINSPPDVEFSLGAIPSELPGANNASPPFVTTPGFSSDADEPIASNGVNPGEMLGIQFDLQGGQSFADVLADLANGSLRVGIRVQDFASGGSESLVNIPEPATGLLVAMGLCVIGRRTRQV